MPAAPAIAAVNALRRIAAACRDGRVLAAEDAEAVGVAIRNYLAKAAGGLTLGGAFGVETEQGGRSWWEIERLEARDRAIRAAAERLAGSAPQLANELARYVATDWRRDRHLAQLAPEHDGSLRALLHAIARADDGDIPGLPRLRQIVRRRK